MNKGIIYYTDNRLGEPIFSVVQKQILRSGLPVVSVSLKPMDDFGTNTVMDLQPGILSIYQQILMALKHSSADIVFFCEHDVLYHPSHFEFIPPYDSIFYYNTNVWRWQYPLDRAITYDQIASLSGLCVYRKLALDHYTYRINKVYEMGWDKDDDKREPKWSRLIGHEPGTKKIKKCGITDDDHVVWKSQYPNIDIRHGTTLSRPKCSLVEFKHPPSLDSWKETTLDKIEGWNNIMERFQQ
jgi:hypothetical protein